MVGLGLLWSLITRFLTVVFPRFLGFDVFCTPGY